LTLAGSERAVKDSDEETLLYEFEDTLEWSAVCDRVEPTAEFYSWTEGKKLRDTSNRAVRSGSRSGHGKGERRPPRPMARNLHRLEAGARP